jgi:hypothetical protein
MVDVRLRVPITRKNTRRASMNTIGRIAQAMLN